jgi:DNA-damage-inducible protein D
MESHIAVFKGKEIRKTIHENEWWFVVEDIVLALIDSKDSKQYIQRMKQRDPELGKGWVQIVHTLSVETTGGVQNMLCANTEGIFRIIQSIPSPKAEPFKRWLAKVGYERVQEIEDPELGSKRTRALYKAKSYSDDWMRRGRKIHPVNLYYPFCAMQEMGNIIMVGRVDEERILRA